MQCDNISAIMLHDCRSKTEMIKQANFVASIGVLLNFPVLFIFLFHNKTCLIFQNIPLR